MTDRKITPMDGVQASRSANTEPTKRTATYTIIDPDTRTAISNPKRPKLDLDKTKKVTVLKALIQGYLNIFAAFEFQQTEKFNLNICHQITSIVSTIHNVKRTTANGFNSNAARKIQTASFTITSKGVQVSKPNDTIIKAWDDAVTKFGLVYKKFNPNDGDNWLGKMGPYLNFSGAFVLRLNELRRGHSLMQLEKRNNKSYATRVSSYGLQGMHHILLEGITYPPERRSSMAQGMGPMAAFFCMLRSKSPYREKWTDAVKRSVSMITCIDDIIEITEHQNSAGELKTIASILAEIILVTTSRQVTSMNFPLAMLSHVYLEIENSKKGDGDKFLERFNCSGAGGYLLYKEATKQSWTIEGSYTKEQAAHVVFHSIFGTFKEDLSILGQIANVGSWFTREELSDCFKKKSNQAISFKLRDLKYYAKLSAANQTGLLSGVYSQISCQQFSDRRIQPFTDDCFEHIQKSTISQGVGKNMTKLTSALSSILDNVQLQIRKTFLGLVWNQMVIQ